MKLAFMFLLLCSLAAAPIAPVYALTAPTQTECASACCEAEPDCCAAACPCPPLSCHSPAAPSVMIPASEALALFAPDHAPRECLHDDSFSDRTARPPVPPPRA